MGNPESLPGPPAFDSGCLSRNKSARRGSQFTMRLPTPVPEDLIKKFIILAIQLGKRQNELLVEAIEVLLAKHVINPSNHLQS